MNISNSGKLYLANMLEFLRYGLTAVDITASEAAF
jgi:hypothetical protein